MFEAGDLREQLERLEAKARWRGQVRLDDGYDRYLARFGDGPEVVVGLHGGPGADLRTLLPLGGLGDAEIEVVLYDQLGGGRSSRPDLEQLWTVERFVDEFEALVESLDLAPVHLLGQSWGGMLALECALRRPDLVSSLILCDTLASTEDAIDGFSEFLDDLPQAVRDAIAAGYEADPSDRSEVGDGVLTLNATHGRRCTPFDLERSRREFVELSEVLFDGIGPAYRTMWGPSEWAPDGNLRHWSVKERLGEISVPALVVCGAHDEITPSCHRHIVEGLSDVRWLILGQSSHCLFQEAEVEVLLPAIRGFVLEAGDSTES